MTTENITIREEVRQDDRIRTISNISNRDDVRIATYVCINETIRPHSEVRKGAEVSTQRCRRQRKTYYGSNSRLHKLRVINPGLFGAPQPKEVKWTKHAIMYYNYTMFTTADLLIPIGKQSIVMQCANRSSV